MSTDTALRVPGVKGRTIVPGDAEYDAARTPFYGGIDKRPRAIVLAIDADDVARVVVFARERGLELAVRSGGHSGVGHSLSDGGIVLDLKALRDLAIDPAGHTAWVGAGLTTGEYSAAAHAYGLATSFGDSGSVGIGGITVGGGVGFLARKYGLTIDSLLAAEVVLADGTQVRADANTNPDLFWAIRGGGGNFGVVTRLKLRLHEAGRVYGGMLFIPATPETIEQFVHLADAAPDELTAIANVMPIPPMPFVPAEHHGKLAIWALMICTGPVERGERTVAPLRSIAKPFADMLHPMGYPEIYLPEDTSYHPIAVNRCHYVDDVDAAWSKAVVERLAIAPAFGVTQIRVLGGAVARVPNDATAYAHRARRIMATTAAIFDRVEDRDENERWLDESLAALRRGPDAAYVNFLTSDGPARVRAAYPSGTWERLVALKGRYDPTNLFHLNHNISPA